MRKLLTAILLAFIGLAHTWAQNGTNAFSVGANVVYGSLSDNLGLGVRVQYTLLNNLRTEAGFNYFFKNDGVSLWDINLNAEYLFGLLDNKLYLYPIAGLSFAHTNADKTRLESDYISGGDHDHSAFGLNMGVGAEYRLTHRIGISLEYRHSIMKDIDQGVIGLGINYTFQI